MTTNLAVISHESKIAVPRGVFFAYLLYSLLVGVMLFTAIVLPGKVPFIAGWICGLVLTMFWPVVAVCMFCFKLLPLLFIQVSTTTWVALAVYLMAPLAVRGQPYRTVLRRITAALLLGPYAMMLYISNHAHYKNERLTQKQAQVWAVANVLSLLFVFPIIPLIYCYLYRDRSSKIQISGCGQLDHLESSDQSSVGQIQGAGFERKRSLI